MTWTTQKPTKPGWYWYRWPSNPQLGAEIIEITQPDGPDTDTLGMGNPYCGWTLDEYLAEHGPVEWQGPLEPTERDEGETQP